MVAVVPRSMASSSVSINRVSRGLAVTLDNEEPETPKPQYPKVPKHFRATLVRFDSDVVFLNMQSYEKCIL